MIVIDSSGWLDYFMNGQCVEQYADLVNKTDEIITPTLVLYEVHKILKRELNEERALWVSGQMEKTELVPLSPILAYQAADLSLEHKLATADSIIYATALAHNAKLYTSDADFKNLPGVVYFPSDGPIQ